MTRNAYLLIPIAVLSAGVILAGIAGVGTDGPSTEPGDRDSLRDEMNRRIPVLLERQTIPGASVAVMHDGDIAWARGYGVADELNEVPVDVDTVFQVGSISKTVSAWGVMRLVQDGTLHLDTPVSDYLTRWNLPPSEFNNDDVTVRRLLSHTAGLSLHGYLGFDPESPVQTLEESLTFASDSGAGVAVVFEPGTQWSYSGGGYALLELVVEEVTGMSFAEYMDQEVLQPLGMVDSTFEWDPRRQHTLATPFGSDGRSLPNYLFSARAAAGFYTTAPDFARLLQATAADPGGAGVLDPEVLDLLLTPAPNATVLETNGYRVQYGLGYVLKAVGSDEARMLAFHSGANQGWRAQYWVIPSDKEGLVILTNSEEGAALLDEIHCVWIEWATGSPAQECQPFLGHRVMIAAGTGGLFVTLVWFGVSLRRHTRSPGRVRD